MNEKHHAFECYKDCNVCDGEGTVCESHPDKIWGSIISDKDNGDKRGCWCGSPGMTCLESKKQKPIKLNCQHCNTEFEVKLEPAHFVTVDFGEQVRDEYKCDDCGVTAIVKGRAILEAYICGTEYGFEHKMD